MPRALALLGVVAALTVPTVARAATCADLGPAAPFDVLSNGVYTVANTQVQGRVAAAGDVTIASYGVGTALSPDATRLDLIAGGALNASNAQAHTGSVAYGTTLTGTISTPNGTLGRQPGAFAFADAFASLETLSARLDDLAANSTVSGPTYGALDLTGSDPDRNVFDITAAKLQTAQQIRFRVPFGSTTIVNVSGTTYSSATLPTTSMSFWNGSSYVQFGETAPTPQLDALRRALLWNFPLANRIQIGPNMAWQGSVLAPDPSVRFEGSTQLLGQLIGASVIGNGTIIRRPFAGCLPPAPTRDLQLTALCRNAGSDDTVLRLRNTGADDVTVTWTDADSAQTGVLLARAGHDLYFTVADGQRAHRITVRSATESVQAQTAVRACSGTIAVTKVVTGDGTPPAGAWDVVVSGGPGYTASAPIVAGQTVTFTVPGDYEPGSAPIGSVVGGFTYAVTEPDPRGGVATVSQSPVTILDGTTESVVIGNAYAAAVTPPDGGGGGEGPGGGDPDPPLPEPGGPVVTPSQPTLVPGAPAPADGPGLVAGAAAAGADLTISEKIAPKRIALGRVASSTLTIRNLGTVTADDVVVREIPQRDPKHPNRVVRLVAIEGGVSCNGRRPGRCTLGRLEPGARVTLIARGAVLRTGSLKSVVQVASATPETNTTNNVASDGIVVTRPTPPLRVTVRAPAVARAGAVVRYRVRVTAPGAGVSAVHLCHRPSRGLLVTTTPAGTHRLDGRLCLDVRRLRAGTSRSFTVRAVASQQYAGRSARLPATATSPDRVRPATGAARTRIVGAEPSGLG